jgi:hypothetical protein
MMVILTTFVLLVFLYSLVSRRLEHTIITAPMAGRLIFPHLSLWEAGISALPGIDLYTRRVVTLAATSPENRPQPGWC